MECARCCAVVVEEKRSGLRDRKLNGSIRPASGTSRGTPLSHSLSAAAASHSSHPPPLTRSHTCKGVRLIHYSHTRQTWFVATRDGSAVAVIAECGRSPAAPRHDRAASRIHSITMHAHRRCSPPMRLLPPTLLSLSRRSLRSAAERAYRVAPEALRSPSRS